MVDADGRCEAAADWTMPPVINTAPVAAAIA
jgi:hypothetical protein